MTSCKQLSSDPEPNHKPQSYVLDYPSYVGVPDIPADNPLTVEGVALGRRLFYEKRLSADNSMSCASCHQQSRAFTDGNQFSKGVKGEPGDRNSMSLANLAWTNRFFWNGRAESLEEQALEPIQDEIELHQSLDQTVKKLQNTPPYPDMFKKAFGSDQVSSENIAKALAQFQRTLISFNSPYDRSLMGEVQLTEQEKRGERLFFTHPEPKNQVRGGNCGDCHRNPITSGERSTFGGFSNNGLDNGQNLAPGLESVTGIIADKGKFKVPTLRNIALTAPYMHDGRFQTLEEVLDHYNEHIQLSETLDPLIIEASNEVEYDKSKGIKLFLTEEEKADIIAFLHTLSDSLFINNPEFSNPIE
ncbi:cytochrome-c peroxidase [Cytophagales bacterium RKSG123]|nr:cytochrome c peroxidase [Xanthovirga aplysinae]MTI32663.1 cytochrome-c peroxidase [Xanthovirga aplysinae]